MTFAVNGKGLLVASLTEPIRGAWVVDVEVDAEQALPARVTVDMGAGASFVGTVVRGGIFQGRWVARIVGGKGGLSIDVGSRYYDAVPVKTVLSDLMRDSGEELDGTISQELLGRPLARWIRPSGHPQLALDDLANELGVTWRITRAGKVWLGAEKWPELTAPAAEITPGPSTGTVSIAPAEAALVRPGVTYLGKRVSLVTTTLQGGKLRQVVWHDEGTGDRLLASLSALVGRILGRRLDYLATYPSTVVLQSSDGLSLEVLPDDERVRGKGLRRVPIRHGSPGWGVRVPRGTRIMLGFDNGDPRRPYVAGWEPGSVDLVTFADGTQAAARQGDMVIAPFTFENLTQLCTLMQCGTVGTPPTPNPAAAAILLATPLNIYAVVSSGSTKFLIGG